jgi:hypothetical protein
MSTVNEAEARGDWSDRIVGDPRYTRAMWTGDAPMPAPKTARERWEYRQALLWAGDDAPYRARIFLPILDAFIAEMGPRALGWTLGGFREGLADLAAEAGGNKRGTRAGGSR